MDFKEKFNDLTFIYFNSQDRVTREKAKTEMLSMIDSTIERALPYLVDKWKLEFIKNVSCIDLPDVKQECLIIFLKTLDSFDPSRGLSLYKYFKFNIRRMIQQLYFSSKRKKRGRYKVFSEFVNEEENCEMPIELFLNSRIDGKENEYTMMIRDIENSDIKQIILKKTKGIENRVAELLFLGYRNKEISEELHLNPTKVTRLSQSIKEKIKHIISI